MATDSSGDIVAVDFDGLVSCLAGRAQVATPPDAVSASTAGVLIARAPGVLVVEAFDARFGCCSVMRPTIDAWLREMRAGEEIDGGVITANHAVLDTHRVLTDTLATSTRRSAKDVTEADAHLRAQLRQSVTQMLHPFSSTIEPTFFILSLPFIRGAEFSADSDPHSVAMRLAASASLEAVIEGPDIASLTASLKMVLDRIEASLRATSGSVAEDLRPEAGLLPAERSPRAFGSDGGEGVLVDRWSAAVLASAVGANLALPPLRSLKTRAAFRIQARWRKLLSRKRSGEYIDGRYYTHSEAAAHRKLIADLEAAEAARATAATHAATTIQRVYHGFVGRRVAKVRRDEVQANPKLRHAWVRRRAKRGTLYGSDGLPPSVDQKLKVLAKATGADGRTSGSVARRRSLSLTVSGPLKIRPELLSEDERAVLSRKIRL
jgi:hypothetical protein